MSRRCEVLTEQQTWQEIAADTITAGMIYRIVGPDGPERDVETGEPIRWRARSDVTRNADGALETDSERVDETEIERAVRETGLYWPGGYQAGGWTPGRLR